jgi:hypothetical protein
VAQTSVAEENHPIETLFADRAPEPLRVGIGIRRLNRRLHDAHTGVPSGEPMPFCCETAALVILQPQAVALQLLSENSILFYEVLADVLLVAIYPSGEGHEQKP